MRKFATAIMAFLLIHFSLSTSAQTITVTGRVIGSDNNPIPSASVLVKGKRTGTKTDANGNFTITANRGDVLVISGVGFTPQDVKINALSINITLNSSNSVLEGVVITAMDIKRNSRELGYSAQSITGTEIQQTQRENFLNSLQGRVAGLTITPTTGAAGASSTINLRGFNSSGNNQPLFIIDGVILDNQTIDENSNGGSGLGLASDRPNRSTDYTNRIGDLNPSDIESITVLKGPEATALYGSQANSGAIVITSKKPGTNGKLSVIYDNAFRMQKITRFPLINTDYGPGTNGNPSTTTFTNFGPAYGASDTKYDNLHNFFKTGFSQTHNLGVDFGKKNVGFRFSSSYFDQDGVVPQNTFKRINLKLSNNSKIGKYIEITPSIAYINSVNDKPVRGAGGYLLDLFAWPVTNDVRNYLDKSGNRLFALPAQDPAVESDNPLFSVYNSHGQDKTDRVIATLGLDFHPFSWLTFSGRFGYDAYKTNGYSLFSPQSSTLVSIGGNSVSGVTLKGALDNYYRRYSGYNHTIYATAKKSFGQFSTRLMGGTMWQDYETKMFAIIGSKLITPTGTDSSNTDPATRQRLNRNNTGAFNLSILREMAYFGEAGIGYKNLAFLDFTYRFESASVLPLKNRNYNYPAASFSLILTDIFPGLKKGNALNFAKLRASLANTARLPDPYLNQSVFVTNFASSTRPNFSYTFVNNNPDLAPERQRTYETGAEFRFLNNAVLFDATYYNTYCYNQISQNARASYATGFIASTINAASLRNQGIELSLDVTPIKNNNFNWDIRFNFNHTWSKVLTLPESIPLTGDYYNSDTWLVNNARGGFVRGYPTTEITGWSYTRNNAGQILINPANGLPVINSTSFLPIGDRNPKFTLGTLNNIRYKNWNLSFLWDLKVGGDIFNGTDMYLTAIGRSQRTADRATPRVISGVLNDGFQNTATPTKNTIVVIPYFASTNYYGESTGLPDEEFVQHNVNWLRLRDVTLNYSLPQNIVHAIKGLKSLNVFVTGNDLVLFTNYYGADPAVNGTTSATRGVGGFGFDYGDLPSPLQLNFGFRANF